jgi:hypothetical protein
VNRVPEAGGIDLQIRGGAAHAVFPFVFRHSGMVGKHQTRNFAIPGSTLTHRPE